jgi:CBS domain-containing protein
MPIGHICSRVTATASPDETVETGARRMAEYAVGTLVVLAPDRTPRGIVTDRDLVVRALARGLDAATTPLSEVMTEPVRTGHEALPLAEGLAVLQQLGARRLVVVDDEGALAGVLSLDDILGVLIEQAERVGSVLHKQAGRVLAKT